MVVFGVPVAHEDEPIREEIGILVRGVSLGRAASHCGSASRGSGRLEEPRNSRPLNNTPVFSFSEPSFVLC
jgi:hypothetical protein